MKKSLLRANEGLTDATSPAQPSGDISEAYDRHIETVYRVCYSLTGNRQDAEDAAQSVFIKLMESGKSFHDAEHEKAWLIVSARNRCRDLHRRWWKKKVVSLDPHAIVRTGEDDDRHKSKLEDNLRKLPATYRLLLYLYYYEGYKLAEIAAILQLNLNTVKTKMRSARKQLKLEIGGDDHA